jgi:hypothetical protein
MLVRLAEMNGISGGLLHALLFFKQSVQGVSFFLLETVRCRGFERISEGKVVAEISPILFEHPFGLCFPALVIGFNVIKAAVAAAA